MSIPKEPRQLMINIMYLVLLALLALNVSAKIFKAFEKVDHSLENSNSTLMTANTSTLPDQIKKAAKKDKQYDKYVERISPLRQATQEFVEKVTSIEERLIDEGGNRDGKFDDGDKTMRGGHLELIGKKDKSATTRLMIEGMEGQEPLGPELKAAIDKLVAEYPQFFDEEDKANADKYVSLDISDDLEAVDEDPKVPNWWHYNFNQMPIGATMPIFEKLRNDAISTENAILNYFSNKVGGEDIVVDKFQVMSSPEKTYVIQGEKFNTKVFLTASAGESSNAKIDISVNGANLSVNDEGAAEWSQTANGTGLKKYSATISVTNPVTDSTSVYKREFEYEVGLRSVAVSADKMNVFYIGVENPITVSAAGVPSNSLRVTSSGAGGLTLSKKSKNTYTAKVKKPTKINEYSYVVVSGEGLQQTRFPFRVKRIPDPVARLGGKETGGNIGNGTFKAQRGLIAMLDNFDFEARCQIVGFQLTRQSRNSDPIDVTNKGGTYGTDSKRLVNQAKPGDTYYFDNVRASCPGDIASRKINQMVFRIK